MNLALATSIIEVLSPHSSREYLIAKIDNLEYRINGGVRIIGGGLEMVRYNNNRGAGIMGGCLEKQKIVVFLGKHVYNIYVNSDVTDTFTFELWFC